MKVSTILDHIDNGHMALPVFQRGYVWNRDQVKGLMDSLYRRHPVGSLLVWATESKTAEHKGKSQLAPGIVKLLLDGQQRITSLYGIIKGELPEFFDGDPDTLSGLYFNVETEEFSYYQPVRMSGDPKWIDVTRLMKAGNEGIGSYITQFTDGDGTSLPRFLGRLNSLLGIKDIELHAEEVTGADKTIEVVVDIFNRVNSGGTKLSKGDLALAKICGEWPEGRQRMKDALAGWNGAGFQFKLDWLLRSVNTVATGEALFIHLDGLPVETVQDSLERAVRHIDYALNLIGGRLGLDHDRVFFGKYAMPIIACYLDRRGGSFRNTKESDQVLYWYLSCAMWGRYSGSTESNLDQDLEALERSDLDIAALVEQLRLWRGGSLQVVSDNFSGYGRGARFYPVLYMLSRVGGAMDWGLGVPLKQHMLGKMSKLERHHVFPKALLSKHGYAQSERNAIANFCFQTKQTNLEISDRPPAEYFPKVESSHPGALASQWIPMDESLWQIENYPEFLSARRTLLTDAIGNLLSELGHGLHDHLASVQSATTPQSEVVAGGIETEEEEEALNQTNQWMTARNLPEGELLFEVSNPNTGVPVCIIDLAWPQGIQEGLSEPVALLLDESPTVAIAVARHGFRCFASIHEFKEYVLEEILASVEREPVIA